MAPSPKRCPPRPRPPSTPRFGRPGPQEPPRYSIPQSRLGEKLLGQGDVGDVGRGEVVGERDPIGGADEVLLHPVDAEGPPPHPRRPGEARALRDLPGVQNRKQSRVDEQRLRVADHLVEDVPPQGFQKTPELPHPPMERGRVQPHHPGEQVREEPLGLAQERAFAFHASQLLKEGEGDDFRVREALYGFVAAGTGVEMSVSVVAMRQKSAVRASSVWRRREVWLGWAIFRSLVRGDYDGPLSISYLIHATNI